ncbi:peptidoglycan-binding domain-containing protein [Streptomyces spiramyceticus]|uniref:peptidoglycan-binding domain-containing protein n=1 Tax=Streptomyces spiramyceticus TaxID=299717 RepID=UPI00237BF0D0|nr:peptidoglycan-binding domain-containing protein [Streptomyces spiramyceticus]
MNGHICPECGTDRGSTSDDGRPGCECAERTAEAVRAERTAQVAAAEDFNPLRIRPYVTLEEPAPGEAPPRPVVAYLDGDAAVTMPLGVVSGSGAEPDGTAAMDAVNDPANDPFAFPSPFEEPSGHPRQRRRPAALWLAVGTAAVAVVGTAAFAGGVFTGVEEEERALPDTVTSAPSASDGPERSASESAAESKSPSASASTSTSPSATPSPSASLTASAGPSPSSSRPVTATPSATPSTARATGAVEEEPETSGVTLSRGDRGPEVVELQDRLSQIRLYSGPENGHFSERVEDSVRTFQSYMSVEGDPEGTYGPNTRRALEAQTEEP